MREIKFRAKTKGNEWVYGYYVYTYPNEHRIFGKDRTSIEVMPDSVVQFTGLLDKNGKEIYEGDIVEVLDTRMAVTYVNSSFRLRECTLACYDTKSIEVIGNIHENPELLEQEV